MNDLSDMDLVRQFNQQGSEEAFAALVQRHANLVFSVAFRHAGNTAHAEEITQAVFIVLARKSASLRPDTVLEGWLYETTRLTSLSFLRGERRRQWREQEAYMQSTLQEPTDTSIWKQIAPLLDEAMARLGEKDRDAVVLRYFNGKKINEVAIALKTSEAAAQSRVLRAVDKLRKFFNKRGVMFPTAVLTAAISANSVQAAPVALTKSVTAVAIVKGATASSSTLILVKGAMNLMAWTKAKMAIFVASGLILVTGVAVESKWIKNIVYFGDSDQSKLWHSRGPKGIQTLIWALESPTSDNTTRMNAASVLCQLGTEYDDKSAIPELINVLKTEKVDRVRALELAYFEVPIQSMDEEDKTDLLPELIRAMQSSNSSVRNNALVALQYYPNQSETVVPLMVKALQDSNPRVRLMAVKALNKIDPQNAAKSNFVAILVGCVTAPSGDTSGVANDAVIMLGELQREPDLAVPVLIQCLQNNDPYVRQNSANALGRFGVQAKPAVTALLKALKDSDANVRIQAAAALQRINA